jgi:hypothetical protein
MVFKIHESISYWQEQLFIMLVMEVVPSNKESAESTSFPIWNL